MLALAAILSWVGLTIIDIILLLGSNNQIQPGTPLEPSRFLLNIFFIFLFLFYDKKISNADSINFIDLLWRVFATGLMATVLALSIRFFLFALSNHKFTENIITINFLYHLNIGAIGAFLISTLVVFKRLILYQKSKRLLRFWQVLQYSLLASIFFNFFGYTLFDTPFMILLATLTVMGLLLSANLKWVAYLNFKQKWKSILLILLVIIYLYYFFSYLLSSSDNYPLINDLFQNVFILATIAFILIYSVFSLLVILFNLPTSSVFEQKLGDVINFQRLSQSIEAGQTVEGVYDILLDSSVSAVLADAAWLEINNESTDRPNYYKHKIDEATISKIKKILSSTKSKSILDIGLAIRNSSSKFIATLKDDKFKSALVLPLTAQENEIGMLVLLKDVTDGFNKEMIDIINTFANQASISIENFQLLSEALENERYKEELKIAKRVQSALLPQNLTQADEFEIIAFSQAADEVGGDYYDTYRINEHKIAVVIGDVSGKGTSAAFNMSQMKGIFHSLAQLDMAPDKFLIQANSALSRCLEKASFITLSYYLIDTKNSQVSFSRAGHSPTLYYCKKEGVVKYFENKGLGLGILRNSKYESHVQVNNFNYNSGDIMLLYTDGIVEAKNEQQLEFGYDRLKSILERTKNEEPTVIQEKIIQEVYDFCGTENLNDDYTTLIVKFK